MRKSGIKKKTRHAGPTPRLSLSVNNGSANLSTEISSTIQVFFPPMLPQPAHLITGHCCRGSCRPSCQMAERTNGLFKELLTSVGQRRGVAMTASFRIGLTAWGKRHRAGVCEGIGEEGKWLGKVVKGFVGDVLLYLYIGGLVCVYVCVDLFVYVDA